MGDGWRGTVLVLLLHGAFLVPCPAAGAGFVEGGRPVTPEETNFAGGRRATPIHRVPVQINHDTRAGVDLDLTLVDTVFDALRVHHRRDPYVAPQTIPVVVIAEAKMRRFLQGPPRLLFGRLEAEVKSQQQDVYPTPTAVFVSDAVLGDPVRLQAALRRGLGYLFDVDFYRAVTGLERARPRPAD